MTIVTKETDFVFQFFLDIC